jgi:hypothetical protein
MYFRSPARGKKGGALKVWRKRGRRLVAGRLLGGAEAATRNDTGVRSSLRSLQDRGERGSSRTAE